MSERLYELFDEYAASYARGDRPDAAVYLSRAGDEREELVTLLDEFLRRAPVLSPTEDEVRLLGLMVAEEPPLLALRVRRGIKVDEIVNALIDRLGLEPTKRPKVMRYYQRLEGGLLAPRGVSRRVRSVLAEMLGGAVESAISWTAPPIAPASAYLRQSERLAAVPSAPVSAEAEEDEIDRLFTGGEQA